MFAVTPVNDEFEILTLRDRTVQAGLLGGLASTLRTERTEVIAHANEADKDSRMRGQLIFQIA